MRKSGSQTELGTVRIHKNVIASIAAIAAGEIDGVKRVGGDFKSGIMSLIGRKCEGYITVEFDKNDEVRITIPDRKSVV